jgi:hypothetical protein
MDFFFTYLTKTDGLSVAKCFYCDELSIAKTSNKLSVAKARAMDSPSLKMKVRRCIHTTTASIATVGVRRYNI